MTLAQPTSRPSQTRRPSPFTFITLLILILTLHSPPVAATFAESILRHARKPAAPTISAQGRLRASEAGLQWIRDEGGFVHESAMIASTPHSGIGIIAKTAIPANTLVFRIPIKLTLHTGPDGEPCRSPVCLCVALLQQSLHKNTRYKRYLGTLSRDCVAPLCLSPHDQNAVFAGLDSVTDLIQVHTDMAAAVAEAMGVPLTLGQWGMSQVLSRSWGLLLFPDESPVLTMVPIIDQLNHRRHCGSLTRDKQDPSSLILVTRCRIPAKAEITNDYGAHGFAEFLAQYGFMDAPSPNLDLLTILLDLPPPDPANLTSHRDHQLHLIHSSPSLKPHIRLGLPGLTAPSLTLLRILSLSATDLTAANVSRVLSGNGVSFAHELSTLRGTVALCETIVEDVNAATAALSTRAPRLQSGFAREMLPHADLARNTTRAIAQACVERVEAELRLVGER